MNKLIIYLLSFFFSFAIFTTNAEPVSFLENILSEIKPALMCKDDFFLEKTIRRYVDFNEVAIWVAGKNVWKNTNDIDRVAFIDALATLMLRTYRNTVYHYIDSDVEFLKPKFQSYSDTMSKIQVSSVMKKNNKSVNISYRLIRHESSWLVFDILIEGISILKSLQAQYSTLVKQCGVNYVTKKIQCSNTEK